MPGNIDFTLWLEFPWVLQTITQLYSLLHLIKNVIVNLTDSKISTNCWEMIEILNIKLFVNGRSTSCQEFTKLLPCRSLSFNRPHTFLRIFSGSKFSGLCITRICSLCLCSTIYVITNFFAFFLQWLYNYTFFSPTFIRNSFRIFWFFEISYIIPL